GAAHGPLEADRFHRTGSHLEVTVGIGRHQWRRLAPVSRLLSPLGFAVIENARNRCKRVIGRIALSQFHPPPKGTIRRGRPNLSPWLAAPVPSSLGNEAEFGPFSSANRPRFDVGGGRSPSDRAKHGRTQSTSGLMTFWRIGAPSRALRMLSAVCSLMR